MASADSHLPVPGGAWGRKRKVKAKQLGWPRGGAHISGDGDMDGVLMDGDVDGDTRGDGDCFPWLRASWKPQGWGRASPGWPPPFPPTRPPGATATLLSVTVAPCPAQGGRSGCPQPRVGVCPL